MKEKRYFYDFVAAPLYTRQIVLLLIVPFTVVAIIASIIGNISYHLIMNKYSYELDTYSETTNEYLEEIANEVIKEGSSFNLSAMPKDVADYNVTFDGNHIEFNYVLKNDLTYAPSAHMVMTLSKDFRILQQSFSYNSEKQYKEMTETNISEKSSTIFTLSFAGLLACYMISFIIAMEVSEHHKKRDEEALSKQ